MATKPLSPSPEKMVFVASQNKSKLPWGFWTKGDKDIVYTAKSWLAMLNRVFGKTPNKNYKNMFFDPSWLDFYVFLDDMGIRPKNYTLDRIDVTKGYFKENCRWANHEQQANNKKTSKFIEFNGEILTIAQWGKKLGGSPELIDNRLRYGWSVEKALTTGVKNGK